MKDFAELFPGLPLPLETSDGSFIPHPLMRDAIIAMIDEWLARDEDDEILKAVVLDLKHWLLKQKTN